MPKRLKAILQYVLIIGVTIFLIWFSLRGLDGENKWKYISNTWHNANKYWLLCMALLAMLSHVIRAQRWRILLKPAGCESTLTHSFLSLMTGYLVNLVIPRGGEVSRCYNLYRLNKSPVEVSFGTVVIERIVDVLCLLVLLVIAFSVEYEKLMAFVNTLPIHPTSFLDKLEIVLIGVGVLVAIAVTLYFVTKRNQKIKKSLMNILRGFKSGLATIFKLERRGLFIFYSIAIWVLYFLMSYAVIKAFAETSHLGMTAVLSLFAIGSIAMAVPLPGGTGSYHTLVPAGLTFLYAVDHSDAVAFVFVFHGWQTFIMIVGGAVSMILTHFLVQARAKQPAS